MKALIFAAGIGERMRPLTLSTPKALLLVRGKPLIVHHIEALARAEMRDLVINLSYLGDLIKAALGDGVKRVEANESQTAVLQQRCLRATRDLPAGHVLAASDLEALRPAPDGAARPYELPQLLGRRLVSPLQAGDALHGSALAVRVPLDAALSS